MYEDIEPIKIKRLTDYSPSSYLTLWGHLPFWEDIEGFNKRVKEMEEKFRMEAQTNGNNI